MRPIGTPRELWNLSRIHSVDETASDEERISVSFNLMFSAFTENLAKPLW